MAKSDATEIIERLEDYERRLGVSLKGLSAYVDYGDEDYEDNEICVSVCGEIYSNSGKEIKGDIEVSVVVYDLRGRVVGTSGEYMDSANFYGFEAFEISIYIPVKEISKIKVYPKK